MSKKLIVFTSEQGKTGLSLFFFFYQIYEAILLKVDLSQNLT